MSETDKMDALIALVKKQHEALKNVQCYVTKEFYNKTGSVVDDALDAYDDYARGVEPENPLCLPWSLGDDEGFIHATNSHFLVCTYNALVGNERAAHIVKSANLYPEMMKLCEHLASIGGNPEFIGSVIFDAVRHEAKELIAKANQ